MKGHELAHYLLKLPDLPVIINGWGSDEGFDKTVSGAASFPRNVHRDEDVLFLGYHDEKGKWMLVQPRIEVEGT